MWIPCCSVLQQAYYGVVPPAARCCPDVVSVALGTGSRQSAYPRKRRLVAVASTAAAAVSTATSASSSRSSGILAWSSPSTDQARCRATRTLLRSSSIHPLVVGPGMVSSSSTASVGRRCGRASAALTAVMAAAARSRVSRGPTVADLKEQLRARGLPVSGRKAELLARLGEVSNGTKDAHTGASADIDTSVDVDDEADVDSRPLGSTSSSSSSSPGASSTTFLESNGKSQAEVILQLTVVQLKARLKDRGLPCSGRKAELIQRLAEAAAASVPDANNVVNGKTREVEVLSAPVLFPRPPPVDLKGFLGLSEEVWLPGTVRAVMDFGVFVEVNPPNDGPKQWGTVYGGVDETSTREWRVDEEIFVRVACVDERGGRLCFMPRCMEADGV